MRRQGTLSEVDDALPAEVRGGIAECDQIMAALVG